MTESGRAIEPEEIQTMLPNEWRVENDREGVYGYADGRWTTSFPDSGRIPACFSLRPEGNLWGAIWKEPHRLGDELAAVSDHITGTKERCIAWIAEKAEACEREIDV